jgi:glycyl-tRNA synthetase beta chain
MEKRAQELFSRLRIPYDYLYALATPRRLALLGEVSLHQDPELIKKRGPAWSQAYDSAGNPTEALLGFARSVGAELEDLWTEDTPRGKYVFAEIWEEGRPTREVLSEELPRFLGRLEFPRAMRWGEGAIYFLRPVRWIVCLLGSEVVDFTFAGIPSGRITWGHRFLAPAPGWASLEEAGEYVEVMHQMGVVVDQRSRREKIWFEARQLASSRGGEVEKDEELLEELTYLAEHPTAFLGSFPEEYLDLPRPVLVTVMKHHQRYFPVVAGDKLLPFFIGVRDGDRRNLPEVVRGNERVLRARLADARFFFEEDKKRPLGDLVPSLRGVLFQAGLGTLWEKTCRLVRLVRAMARELGLPPGEQAAAERAAYLSKADLLTKMVYEFPELEGVMGREYALLSGEAPEVAEAIEEHHRPRGSGDPLPTTRVGRILSLANRVDDLVGGFAAGKKFSGSEDPYGLRRQAIGVLEILESSPWDLSLDWLVKEAIRAYQEGEGAVLTFSPEEEKTLEEELRDFFQTRLRWLLEERGVSPEVARAVLIRSWEAPRRAFELARVLELSRREEEFLSAAAMVKRAGHLARAGGEPVRVEERLLREEEEKTLWRELSARREAIEESFARGDYPRYFSLLAGLKPHLDSFLDRVLVMAEKEEIRRNRLSLLGEVARLGTLGADLSLLAP